MEQKIFKQILNSDSPFDVKVSQLLRFSKGVQQFNNLLHSVMVQFDVNCVKQATSGINSNDSILINSICSRSKVELQLAAALFEEKYQKNMIEVICSTMSGDYQRLIKYALMDTAAVDADIFQDSVEGLGTDEALLLEVLSTREPSEIQDMRRVWEAKHHQSMSSRIGSELSGTKKQLALQLLSDGRVDDVRSEALTDQAAMELAKKLHKAGVGKTFGTDEKVFVEIFSNHSRSQLQAISRSYEQEHSMSLQKVIKKEFSGDTKAALLQLTQDPIDFACEKLKNAFKGLGTNELTVIRVIGRLDKDRVGLLCEKYFEKYQKRLVDVLKSELSGNFREACINWINVRYVSEINFQDAHEVWEQVSQSPESEETFNQLKLLTENQLDECEIMLQGIARIDATNIRSACVGIGTNEKKLIDVLVSRSKFHLKRIDIQYRDMYEVSLYDEIDSETSGHFGDFLKVIQMSEEDVDSYYFKKAMDGIGTNESLLLEILTTRTKERRLKARERFEAQTNKNLIDRLNEELSGSLKQFAITLINADQNEQDVLDDSLIERYADELYNAGKGKVLGTDEDIFINIICNNLYSMDKINQKYEEKYNHSLKKAIASEFSGDMEIGLLSILTSPIEGICIRLKKAFAGVGTDDSAVIRLLGSLNKSDVHKVSILYQIKYNRTLSEHLKSELSGSFRKAVIGWVTVQDPFAFIFSLEEEENDQKSMEYVIPQIVDENVNETEEKDDDIKKESDQEEEEEEEENNDVIEEENVEVEVDDNLSDDDEEQNVDDGEETNNEKNEQRKKNKKNEKKKQNKQILQKKNLALKREQHWKRVQTIDKRNRNQFVQFTKKTEGLNRRFTVYGKFDGEEYFNYYKNASASGLSPWEHYKKNGFINGYFMFIRSEFGVFMGAFDGPSYLSRNGIPSLPNNSTVPYFDQLHAWHHYKSQGYDAELDVALKYVIILSVNGQFNNYMYLERYPRVKIASAKPRPGCFDPKGYISANQDVISSGLDPIEHFHQIGWKENRPIMVNQQVGKINKRWYKKKYEKGAPLKHYGNEGIFENLPVKIKPWVTSAWTHYRNHGKEQEFKAFIVNPIGIFCGLFDPIEYAKLHSLPSSELSWEHFISQQSNDKMNNSDTFFAINQIQIIKLHFDVFPSNEIIDLQQFQGQHCVSSSSEQSDIGSKSSSDDNDEN